MLIKHCYRRDSHYRGRHPCLVYDAYGYRNNKRHRNRGKADIIGNYGYNKSCYKQNNKHHVIDSQNRSAKASQTLSALKSHIEGKNMAKHRTYSRNDTCIINVPTHSFRENILSDSKGNKCFKYIKDSYRQSGFFPENYHNIRSSGISGSVFSDIKPF